MDAHTGERTRATIALRPEAVTDEELARYGWDSLNAAAKALGISRSTLARCKDGEMAPGNYVIAALLVGTRRPFDQLFAVVIEPAA